MNRYTGVLLATVLSGAMLFSSCTTNLGPETLPSTSATTEPTETEPEPTETEIPEHTEPSSHAVITDKVVEQYGKLEIYGTNIVNSEGETVVLKGMSSFGLQSCGDFFTSEVVKTLAEDWGCDVLRITLTGDKYSEGYIKEPDKYFDMVCKICDMCIEQGIYVIVDWNMLYTEAADENKESAVDFFTRLSAIYSDTPNVLYEITNDSFNDDGEQTVEEEWTEDIKPFAADIIDAVRENSTDSIIIVGAPSMGSAIDVAADSPLDYDNIAYAYRFFSGSAGDSARELVENALEEDICIIATEWGFCNDQGWGGVFFKESGKWIEFFEEHQMSWINYAIGNDSENDANALNLGSDRYTDEQKDNGHWPDGMLTKSGTYAREQLLYVPQETETESESESEE